MLNGMNDAITFFGISLSVILAKVLYSRVSLPVFLVVAGVYVWWLSR